MFNAFLGNYFLKTPVILLKILFTRNQKYLKSIVLNLYRAIGSDDAVYLTSDLFFFYLLPP